MSDSQILFHSPQSLLTKTGGVRNLVLRNLHGMPYTMVLQSSFGYYQETHPQSPPLRDEETLPGVMAKLTVGGEQPGPRKRKLLPELLLDIIIDGQAEHRSHRPQSRCTRSLWYQPCVHLILNGKVPRRNQRKILRRGLNKIVGLMGDWNNSRMYSLGES